MLARSPLILLPLALLLSGFGPFSTPNAPRTQDAAGTTLGSHRGPPAAQAKEGSKAPDNSHPFSLAYGFYHYVVSPMDGARCPHWPTCSAFAMQAVRRRGLLLGLMLTVDRLWNSGNSSVLRSLPTRWFGKRLRFFDPLSFETFWLDGVAPLSSWPVEDPASARSRRLALEPSL